MGPQSIIVWLIVGAIAGWLAGMVVKGGGFGLIGDIVVGIIGAVIAGYLLPALGIHLGVGIVANIIDAFIGAVILLIDPAPDQTRIKTSHLGTRRGEAGLRVLQCRAASLRPSRLRGASPGCLCSD